MYFNSQIAYIEGQKIQVRVSAEVLNPLTGEMKTTNVFHFTYEIREGKPKMIIPKTYHEGKSFLQIREGNNKIKVCSFFFEISECFSYNLQVIYNKNICGLGRYKQ